MLQSRVLKKLSHAVESLKLSSEKKIGTIILGILIEVSLKFSLEKFGIILLKHTPRYVGSISLLILEIPSPEKAVYIFSAVIHPSTHPHPYPPPPPHWWWWHLWWSWNSRAEQ